MAYATLAKCVIAFSVLPAARARVQWVKALKEDGRWNGRWKKAAPAEVQKPALRSGSAPPAIATPPAAPPAGVRSLPRRERNRKGDDYMEKSKEIGRQAARASPQQAGIISVAGGGDEDDETDDAKIEFGWCTSYSESDISPWKALCILLIELPFLFARFIVRVFFCIGLTCFGKGARTLVSGFFQKWNDLGGCCQFVWVGVALVLVAGIFWAVCRHYNQFTSVADFEEPSGAVKAMVMGVCMVFVIGIVFSNLLLDCQAGKLPCFGYFLGFIVSSLCKLVRMNYGNKFKDARNAMVFFTFCEEPFLIFINVLIANLYVRMGADFMPTTPGAALGHTLALLAENAAKTGIAIGLYYFLYTQIFYDGLQSIKDFKAGWMPTTHFQFGFGRLGAGALAFLFIAIHVACDLVQYTFSMSLQKWIKDWSRDEKKGGYGVLTVPGLNPAEIRELAGCLNSYNQIRDPDSLKSLKDSGIIVGELQSFGEAGQQKLLTVTVKPANGGRGIETVCIKAAQKYASDQTGGCTFEAEFQRRVPHGISSPIFAKQCGNKLSKFFAKFDGLLATHLLMPLLQECADGNYCCVNEEAELQVSSRNAVRLLEQEQLKLARS